MTHHLGFHEVIVEHSNIIQWRQITIDTGAAQSTLQDIKVPEYGGSYIFKKQSPSTYNRYIFWRVCHDIVELWEESLDINFHHNYIQLRFADTPVLEGLSVHETSQHVVILLATVSSIHRLRLPHPLANLNGEHHHSVFKDLNFHSLRDFHNQHLLNTNAAGEGLPHTAATHLVSNGAGKGDAIFVLGHNGGSLVIASMANLPYAVHLSTVKTASLLNRLFTGFVPAMFRGMEGAETVSSLVLEQFKGDILAFGICLDGRLRAWSCTKQECVLAHHVLENTAEAATRMVPGAQRHLIRSFSSADVTYLAVFLSFAEKQMLLIFAPAVTMGTLSLQLIKTLYPPQYDLIDLAITSTYIWSLWTDSNNEAKLLYSLVNFNGYAMNTPGLKSAFLEPFPEKEIPLSDPSVAPSEVYLKELMAPNRFSAYTLQKALGIYKRTLDMSKLGGRDSNEVCSGLWRMADVVEEALKEEVQMHTNSDMLEEEVSDVTLNAWATFYSHTLQYHQMAMKAVGLVCVGGGGLVAIMRKQSLSWVRPLDALELLSFGPLDQNCVAALNSTPILSEDASIAAAAVAVAKPLRTVRKAIEPEVAVAFSQDLFHLDSPDLVANTIATELLSASGFGESEFEEPLSRILTSQLCGVSGIISGFQGFLRSLELDLGNPDALTLESDSAYPTPKMPTWLSGAFASRLGASIISAVVSQLADHRLQLCRDLLLLQQIILQLNILSPQVKNKIHSTLSPQTTLLTQAYFALARLCFSPAALPTPSNFETSRRQMASLGLREVPPPSPSLLCSSPPTTLELFVLSSGGVQARALVGASLEEEAVNDVSWAQALMPLATTVAQLAWPISKCLALVEFLVWSNQHATAQEYIRLLQPWCEWNSCSRNFLMGVSLLNRGEARKAKRLLLAASEGISTEDFLCTKISGGGPNTPLEEAQVQYFLKCIRLLEQGGHPALALEVSESAIALAPTHDPGLAALYAVAFKFYLELEHHDEAFTALMACPDEHRRRNCLRQLVITLYERKCLSSLVTYNYGPLEAEVITILENRARSADILVTNYYDILFAFHISKHNFKKGAWVMYECALRLNKEGLGEKGLHQQAKCYLACINCLRHIPSDQAWIIKPIVGSSSSPLQSLNEETDEAYEGPSNRLRRLLKSKKPAQIQVLEIADLEREYQLVHSRLKLFKVHKSATFQLPGGPMSASDTVSLLTHGKLFRNALKLCYLFDLPMEPVLEGLTAACIEADAEEDKNNNWNWLSENGIHRDTCEGAAWWTLLQQVLSEEEKGLQSHLHRAVTSVLLQRGRGVPAWLHDSYKKRNCGELINLYLREGHIEEATRLGCSFIDGLLGVGAEQMGLKNVLHVSAPAVWVPYNVIDHLILELKELQKQPQYEKMLCSFSEKLEKYQVELRRVSYDKFLMT